MDYDGKIVLVTGAGSGIGKAIAKMFALEGAFVAACDIDKIRVQKTVTEITQSGGKAISKDFDVTEEYSIREAVEQVLEEYGPIDVLINSAGIIFLGKIEDISTKQWDRVLDVNLKGTFLMSKEVIPGMKERKKGCIINITAAAAKTGGLNVGGNYVASKGGISALTIHLAKQLAPFGIRVNAISPGPVDTPMLGGDSKGSDQTGTGKVKDTGKQTGKGTDPGTNTGAETGADYNSEMLENIVKSVPLGMGHPEDIAYGALFLADEKRARYITGEILDIDGGLFMD
jgi:3-oxoacyl-[acyl-carrier protein] reductase